MAQKGKIRDLQEQLRRQTQVVAGLTKYNDIYRERIKELEMKVKTLTIPVVSKQSEQLAIAALNKVAHPIKYLQDEAEKEGCKLNGTSAIYLTRDINFYQDIAIKALQEIANCY